MGDTKPCTGCGETKCVSEFSKDASRKDGLQPWCKACHAQCSAQWRQEHREEVVQYNAQWYQGHREKRAQYNAQYRQENREEMAQHDAQWSKNNPDKCRAKYHRRRARKLGNGGTHTADDIQRQGDAQGWKCWWQGPGCTIDCKDKYDVDHLMPISRGGHNDPSNIVISCPHCNRSKQDKLPDEWIRRLL